MSSPTVFRSSRTSPRSHSRTGSFPTSVLKNTTFRIGRRRSCSWPADAIREMYHDWYTGGKVDSGCRWPPDGERRDQPGRMKGEARRWGGVIANDCSIPVCHVLPAPATSALRRFLRHFLAKPRDCLAKPQIGTILLGELWPFLKVAAGARTKPQSDASRSAAWSFDWHAVLTVRGPAGSCEQRVSRILRRFLRRLQKRTPTESQVP